VPSSCLRLTDSAVHNPRVPPTSRLARTLEWCLAILALLVVPALILEGRATSPQVRDAAHVLNWIIWLAFCADLAVRWGRDRRWGFLRTVWFELLLIVLTPPFLVPDQLQGARGLRALRLLRLLRAGAMLSVGLRSARRSFAARKFHLVGLFAVAMILLGAAGVFVFEEGQNRTIGGFGDAIWWAIVTATTVGYGDVSPVTLEGRVIAVVLMLTGIGVIGVFTATVASLFFEREESEVAQLAARLDVIERKLDELLQRPFRADRGPE
jgi:voltage-gated potassium channel